MFRLVCVGVLYLILGCHAAGDWCYEHAECGPSTWAEHFPCCGLNSQSPINIVTSEVQHNHNLGPIQISSFARSSTAVVTNNGHTVEVVLNSLHVLSGAGLQNAYQLAGFHFHFGSPQSSDQGSEHLIDGNAFPLEVHFVFYNTNYVDLTEAKTKTDGLAVVGVLFEIGEHNQLLDSLISILPNVAYKGQEATFSSVFWKLLTRSGNSYYKYQGSLTTPPCSENVIWHVISTPQQLSIFQYEAIVSLLYFTSDTEEGIPMVDNFRPAQPLNGRIVYKY
ncbi:carbonic anhydrase-like [Hyla sarda]|uniref:carbonic anhydrase-like n=1 Tax=Hyla sarda TaxID=327740 RepID=UPI0024C33F21|nr:carbonic anhydrase-like [Hyla sarda]XP_056395511.1 carbonic anhydrase-like [Hyla sarda]XP_056395513.1 carbonic anhydrase-like [Hyla sarda]